MRWWRSALVVLVVAGGVFGTAVFPAEARRLPDLSPYWPNGVQRWDEKIQTVATQEEVDPDLIAALIWNESRGNPQAISPKGAVGLMQVMSYEAGFTWRPSQEVLLNPDMNLLWGTRIINKIICQGNGDLLNALAAYNGGWEKINERRPRNYARAVLRDFAGAVASRRGVPEHEHWQVLVAVWEEGAVRGPIWVVDSERTDAYLFGYENRVPEGNHGGVLIPEGVPPTAEVAQCREDVTERTYWVVLWVHRVDPDTWISL